MLGSSRPLRLDVWSRAHAALLLLAVCLAAAAGAPWPVALASACSFGVLLVRARAVFAPHGRVGGANAITALRLLAVCGGAAWLHGAHHLVLAAALLALFALDGIDGYVARRTGTTSEFGAHFDMESDALLVLLVELELWQRGQLGVWILSTGLLRYLYVLCLALFPPRGGEMPRSRLGRYAFALLIAGLTVALALPNAVGSAAAALGSAAVALSFARSFHWSYARRAPGS